MAEYVEEGEQTPPSNPETSLADTFHNLTLASNPETSLADMFHSLTLASNAADPAELRNEPSDAYMSGLRVMVRLFNAGKAAQEIYCLFMSGKKYFPLRFIEQILGSDGGLQAERYPLPLKARMNALSVIIQGHDHRLSYTELQSQLNLLCFSIAEMFYWRMCLSHTRWDLGEEILLFDWE